VVPVHFSIVPHLRGRCSQAIWYVYTAQCRPAPARDTSSDPRRHASPASAEAGYTVPLRCALWWPYLLRSPQNSTSTGMSSTAVSAAQSTAESCTALTHFQMISLRDNYGVRMFGVFFSSSKKEGTAEELGKSPGEGSGCMDVQAEGWSRRGGSGRIPALRTYKDGGGVKSPLKAPGLSEVCHVFFGLFSTVATVWQKRSRLRLSEASSAGKSAARGRRRGTGAILSARGRAACGRLGQAGGPTASRASVPLPDS